jgi:hypothetical protein
VPRLLKRSSGGRGQGEGGIIEHHLSNPFQAFPDFIEVGLNLGELDAVGHAEDIHNRSNRRIVPLPNKGRPLVSGAMDHNRAVSPSQPAPRDL